MITLLVVLARGRGPHCEAPSSNHLSDCGVMGAGGLGLLEVLALLESLGDREGEERRV